MQSSPVRQNYLRFSVRARDFFVDFLACLIPGFITLSILSILFIGLIVICFNNIQFSHAGSIPLTDSILIAIHDKLRLTFWVHVALIACSYAFGFLLFRQDPKLPDFASYIKNRKKVNDYNAWVIPRDKGLSPDDVQFPYSNLANYLESRGFPKSMVEKIHWKPGIDQNGEDSGKSRSKSFINQLKTRISFFFPDSTFQLIKNEAHIRFASSMWYGMKFLTSILYLVLTFYLLMNSDIDNSSINFAENPNLTIVIFLFVVYGITKLEKFISSLKVKKGKYTNFLTLSIKYLSFIYNIFPFTVSIVLLYEIHLSYKISPVQNFFPLIYITIVLCVSLISFYLIEKIEDSFHYQRVREIIYVLETANIAKVDDPDRLEELWRTKCCSNENEVILRNI